MNSPWTLARCSERMNPSVIREILKVTEKPGIIGFAGGLPSVETFAVDAFAQACQRPRLAAMRVQRGVCPAARMGGSQPALGGPPIRASTNASARP